ncbi:MULTISPECIES: GntR family transcriptional regulator [Aliivibrio]|uniref:XRE family transcriptional regulator n=2 Tax=Aliivibrio logei TaxID=688 RepID=A0A1B9P2Q3_ALILO|nr:GntR family transcriptional regulator [Aliivibrio logei]MBB1312243.1 FCD domain-containing protein [Aliivibrio sp. SR45-2]OCH22664.1 XRE family transcriptional regulator [Aliivibrio logei]OEF22816.1 XRE family transcriptional regulator [Aliivibrio logei 5S-186]
MSSPTLTDKVSKMIHQDILSGDLHPGQKLVVAELKKRYNVGASPIREALVQLSWNKYVKLEPQKGCWVATISIVELEELFEGLRVVAKMLLEKAISKGDEAWELSVLTSYHRLSKVNLENTPEAIQEWTQRHSDFHNSLLSGADAPIMFQFYQELTNQIRRYRHLQNTHKMFNKEHTDYLEEHETIMKLALSRNTDQAVVLLESHYIKTMDLLSAYFEA